MVLHTIYIVVSYVKNFVVYYFVRFNTHDFFYAALKSNYLLKHLAGSAIVEARKIDPKSKVFSYSNKMTSRNVSYLTTSEVFSEYIPLK